MKRVLFITDSLGAPRKKPEECTFEELWSYKVSKVTKDIEPVYYNVNGLDTTQLYSETLMKLTLYNPHVVIIQVGIVDCAPRALNKFEQKIVRKMGFIGSIIHGLIKKNYAFITRLRDLSYVSPEKFEQNLENIKREFKEIPVFVVAIGKPSNKYIKKSPLIENRCKIYNSIMKKVFNDYFIDPYKELENDQLEDIYMSDLHHLNIKGQNLVAEHVKIKLFNKENLQINEKVTI